MFRALAIPVSKSAAATAAAVAIGAAFAINNIGMGDDANEVLAEVDDSEVTAGDTITVGADMEAGIFSLGIGAAGSVAGSSGGAGIAVGAAGSVGINAIHNSTQALVHGGSTLTTVEDSGAGIDVGAYDNSWINSTAGAAALSIAVSQKTSVAASLGISVTINQIVNTIRAAVEDSDLDSDAGISVSADSDARIDSLAFGIGVAVAISGGATAISVAATGAVSFNTIDNTVEATIRNAAGGTAEVEAVGDLEVIATDDSTIKAIAIAASASISGSPSATAISVSIGLALAHNTIDKEVSASLLNLPSVLGDNVSVEADDHSTIEVVSVAAALGVALGGGTSVAAAGGASESTNIILSKTNAYIENSTIGSTDDPIGDLSLHAESTGDIHATVAGVAVSLAFGQTGVGIAIGIAVARNFIGWDPTYSPAYDYSSTDHPLSLPAGQKVRVASGPRAGDVYEYLGSTLIAPDLSPSVQTYSNPLLWKPVGFDYRSTDTPAIVTTGKRVKIASGAREGDVYEYRGTTALTSPDLTIQEYANPELWKQVLPPVNAAQVDAYLRDSSVHADGDLTVSSSAEESIDAIVIAVAVAIAGGTSTGVGVSGAGVYTENKIAVDAKAYIQGDGDDGVSAASITVTADNSSGIRAVAGAAAIAAAFSGGVSVAVSIGLSIAFNEVSGDIAAYIKDANTKVEATDGDIVVSATSAGKLLFMLTGVSADDLDDLAKADKDDPDTVANEETADPTDDNGKYVALDDAFRTAGFALHPGAGYQSGAGTKTLNVGNKVLVSPKYGGGGIPGTVYVYVGTNGASVNLSTQNYADLTKWLPSSGTANYESGAGAQTLNRGDTVQVSTAYSGLGTVGLTYRYKGSSGTSLNLGGQSYTGSDWERVLPTVSAMGMGSAWQVVAGNDVYIVTNVATDSGDELHVSRATIDAISVAASVAIAGGVSAAVAVSGAGAVALNVVLTKTNAYIMGSKITEATDVDLDATSTSSISAIIASFSAAVGIGVGTAGIGASIGISIAWN